ncbi:unnamed protein product, partial [Nesidiocoris tenuis]
MALFQEVETFRHRAIEDTNRTVLAMERARTEYRASLSWMKDVSQELDPDTYKQMEKFRKVQETVKQSKAVFDRYKLDCLQKVDLLAAARCNMFSHALILYHNVMNQFATSTSEALNSIADTCKERRSDRRRRSGRQIDGPAGRTEFGSADRACARLGAWSAGRAGGIEGFPAVAIADAGRSDGHVRPISSRCFSGTI